jgi:hypothetical protein
LALRLHPDVAIKLHTQRARVYATLQLLSIAEKQSGAATGHIYHLATRCHQYIRKAILPCRGPFANLKCEEREPYHRCTYMVGGERTTRASTASSLILRRANARRPLTHSLDIPKASLTHTRFYVALSEDHYQLLLLSRGNSERPLVHGTLLSTLSLLPTEGGSKYEQGTCNASCTSTTPHVACPG